MGAQWQGRQLLKAALLKIPARSKVLVQATLERAGEDLMELQRSRVAVKSGALRDSIRMEKLRRAEIGVVILAGGPTTTKPVRRGKSPKYDYAAANELGTREMLAQPFFYPSYRQKKSSIKQRVAISVRAAIKAAGLNPK